MAQTFGIGSTRQDIQDYIDSFPAGEAITIEITADIAFDGVPVTITNQSIVMFVSSPTDSPFTISQTAYDTRHFVVEGDSILALDSITLDGGSSGGGLNVGFGGDASQLISVGNVTISNCRTGESTDNKGGAIYLGENASIDVQAPALTLTGNFADMGGAIYSGNYTLQLYYTNILNNSAAEGGGIYAMDIVYLTLCEVSENVAGGNGGGIYCLGYYGTDVIHRGNSAMNGGAVYVVYSFIIIEGVSFIDNRVSENGGAIFCESGVADSYSESDTVFSGNRASVAYSVPEDVDSNVTYMYILFAEASILNNPLTNYDINQTQTSVFGGFVFTYDPNGPQLSGFDETGLYQPYSTYVLRAPSEITPEYVYDGYTFAYWSLTPDGSGKAYAPGSSYIAVNNATFYAQWIAPSVFSKTLSGIERAREESAGAMAGDSVVYTLKYYLDAFLTPGQSIILQDAFTPTGALGDFEIEEAYYGGVALNLAYVSYDEQTNAWTIDSNALR